MALPKFLIVELSLSGWAGHHAHYVLTCAAAWRRRTGERATVILNEAQGSAAFDAVSKVASVVTVNAAPGGDVDPSESIDLHRNLFEDLQERLNLGQRDLLFCPSASAMLLRTAVDFLCAPAGPRPHLALLFHGGIDSWMRIRSVEWLNKLNAAATRLSIWTTPDQPLRPGSVGNAQVGVLPIPTDHPARQRPSHPTSRQPVLSFLGLPRPAKGVRLLLDALGSPGWAGSIPAHFVIHLPRLESYYSTGDTSVWENVEELARSSSVRLIMEELSPEMFAEILRGSDVMLVPYDPVAYQSRTSAVFVAAAAFGIPLVASNGSSAGRAIAQGHAAGTLFDWDHGATATSCENFQRAITEVISNLGHFQMLAASRRAHWSGSSSDHLIDLLYAESERRS